jgi:single-strand DNA-binding protein
VNDPIAILLRASVHQFIGRLGSDPEIRYFEGGKCVANANIGINWLSNKDQADWIKLEVWGEPAQQFADACRKGYQVHVAGRVKTDRWTDRGTGEEKMQLCCGVESWKVLSKPQGGQAAPAAPAAPAPAVAMATPAPAPTPTPAPAAPVWQSSYPPF